MIGELRRRLAVTEDLASIVRTMRLLSAASVRQFEEAVRSLADYRRCVDPGLRIVLSAENPDAPEPPRRGPAEVGIVAFGSEHGLCGLFNDEMASFVVEQLAVRKETGSSCRVAAVGTRVATRLEGSGVPPERVLPSPSSVGALTEAVHSILLLVDGWHAEGTSEILLAYHGRPSDDGGRLRMEPLLPLDLGRLFPSRAMRWPGRSLPTFKMDTRRLRSALLRQYLFMATFRAFAESSAAEHSGRLRAMESAERSIGEHRTELEANLRRSRQESITSELLDIVSGFEALQPTARKAGRSS